jgi:hypothetical protein
MWEEGEECIEKGTKERRSMWKRMELRKTIHGRKGRMGRKKE